MGYVEHDRSQLGPTGCGRRGVVVSASMLGAVLEPCVLPARSIAPALANQLQVAVEALESVRAKRRRYLPLQTSLRMVALAAERPRHCSESTVVVFFFRRDCAHRSPHHCWTSRRSLRRRQRRHIGTAATGGEKKNRRRRNQP